MRAPAIVAAFWLLVGSGLPGEVWAGEGSGRPAGGNPAGEPGMELVLPSDLIRVPEPRSAIERLDWTWLAAGLTAFAGSAAVLTGLDAWSLEADLQNRLDDARSSVQPGIMVVDLADRAERRANQTTVLWGVTAALGVATGAAYFWETSRTSSSSGADKSDGAEGSIERESIGPQGRATNRDLEASHRLRLVGAFGSNAAGLLISWSFP